MGVSFCLPHPVAVSAFMICSGLCACTEMLWMCVLYVSFGSMVRPRTFGCVAMGSALLSIVRGNIERASTSRSLVRIPISNESLYHATQKKNHGYLTSISMPTTRALIRAGIDSDVDQHRGHVCSKAATTRGVV